MNFVKILLITVIITKSVMSRRIKGRIFNGEEQSIDIHPNVGAFYYFNEFRCGFTLINLSFGVTAAHCTYKCEAENILLRNKMTDQIQEDSIISKVRKIHDHPKFDNITYDYDISMLELEEPIDNSDNFFIIPLPVTPPKIDGNCSVMGWGMTKEKSYPVNSFRIAYVLNLSYKDCCKHPYKYNCNELTPRMHCATVPDQKKDSCHGDSGGPMMCGRNFSGIISWGRGCGRLGYPGVLINITTVLDFLELVLDYPYYL